MTDVEDSLKKPHNPKDILKEASKMEQGASSLLFSRKATSELDVIPQWLEDFKILRVIDKGSFGKVFLVQQEATGKFYAMKWIRKDLLIEKN